MFIYIYIYKTISLRLVMSETKIKKYINNIYIFLTYNKNVNVVNVFFYLKMNF
jgi:hypothetical protein